MLQTLSSGAAAANLVVIPEKDLYVSQETTVCKPSTGVRTMTSGGTVAPTIIVTVEIQMGTFLGTHKAVV